MTVDVVRAEAARFRHPLLLLHGLWTGGWIWSRFAGYLAHRGWESWSPSLLDDDLAPDSAARVQMLLEVCRSMPAAPVIIAHDAAIMTAIGIATEIRSPAVVALAPWLPSRFDRLRMLPQLFSAHMAPPRVDHPLVAGLGEHASRLHRDSGSFVRVLHRAQVRLTAAVAPQPGLIVAARADASTPVERAQRWAESLRWGFDVDESAGHFPMLADGRDRLADRVHRWIVQASGQDLLLWDDEEEEGET